MQRSLIKLPGSTVSLYVLIAEFFMCHFRYGYKQFYEYQQFISSKFANWVLEFWSYLFICLGDRFKCNQLCDQSASSKWLLHNKSSQWYNKYFVYHFLFELVRWKWYQRLFILRCVVFWQPPPKLPIECIFICHFITICDSGRIFWITWKISSHIHKNSIWSISNFH